MSYLFVFCLKFNLNLQVTVNHIGNAYDNLENELIGLAGIKEPKRRPRHDVKFSHKKLDVNTAKTLHNEIMREVNNEKNWKPINEDETETMRDSYNEVKDNVVRNASTITNNPSKTTSVGSDSNPDMYSKSRYSCKLKDMHERQENYKTCGCYF